MGVIEIEGMEFYAFHGHYEEEKKVGNKFIIDISFEGDCEKAAFSDNISDAINYQIAYKTVKKEVLEIKSDLLENLAQRILDSLYKNLPEIKKAKVKVKKMNPQMGGKIKSVSVTLSK